MLLDVDLNGKPDGLEILKEAQKLSPTTKTIMVTGAHKLEIIERARKLGAVDYITKPFTLDYLQTTLKRKLLQCQ